MAEKNYKIDINIVLEEAAGGAKTVEKQLVNGKNQTPEQTITETKNNENKGNSALLFINQYAQMGATKLISNWGDMTGNYIAQDNMQLISNVVDIGLTTLLNWKVGVVKAVVSGASGIAGYVRQQKESERISRFNLYRVGYGKRE